MKLRYIKSNYISIDLHAEWIKFITFFQTSIKANWGFSLNMKYYNIYNYKWKELSSHLEYDATEIINFRVREN